MESELFSHIYICIYKNRGRSVNETGPHSPREQ